MNKKSDFISIVCSTEIVVVLDADHTHLLFKIHCRWIMCYKDRNFQYIRRSHETNVASTFYPVFVLSRPVNR